MSKFVMSLQMGDAYWRKSCNLQLVKFITGGSRKKTTERERGMEMAITNNTLIFSEMKQEIQ